MAGSNTATNSRERGRGKPFRKGDPRINRKGRPKSFDALRALAQQIAHEEAKTKSGDPVIISGHKTTVAEMILRQWAASKNPKLQQAFIEVAFGKVPQNVDVTSGGEKIQPPKKTEIVDAEFVANVFIHLAQANAIAGADDDEADTNTDI